MEWSLSLGYALLGLGIMWVVKYAQRPRRRYPPGPKGIPILGNVFNIPLENSWISFDQWSRQYASDIVHVEALGKHVYVVNSARAAKELFDGRANVYSDKEQSVMMLELCGWSRSWAMLPYGNYWREHHRLFHQHFRPQSMVRYHEKQRRGARRLLQLLLDTPEDYEKHMRYAAGSTILDVVYSFDVQPNDPRIELVEAALGTANDLMHAGIYLVDIFPLLKHIPTWFPGAQFKRLAAKYKRLVDNMYTVPYSQLKASVKLGTAQPCLVASLLSEADEHVTPERDEIFMNLAGTTYAGGTDTIVIALSIFILAMILHPEQQVAVQKEIDRVVGRDRLPELADRESLPRVTAVIQEVLRWHSPLPLATPHRATSDDEYNGYYIKAGSVVIGNAWAMLHNENVYPDPASFKSERFLTPDGKLRDDVPFPIEAFGFGRRICPGRHFALDSLFLLVSHILAVFTIEHAVDADGHIIPVEPEFEPQAFSPPKPFKAQFKLRFLAAEDLIDGSALE
uniref:PAH-inducible cytochrome P450 monooxygenase PC-PAH 6 n=1 Tax=Phanerodontia chrysosporium TaxID=2822231 RepID=A9JR53_PHACH|nr:PAH-inducible cytochrome P450 monooxygenase PC-PAH 6 [Phanerodontia chrysosporium]